MKTETVRAAISGEYDAAMEAAVHQLRSGAVVALPTETVYGLAADALNPQAVLRIFEAKERPRFDPLIVHLPDHDWLERIVLQEGPEAGLVRELVTRFWPGPLTLVLPRQAIVPDVVTAGLETVAVRLSAHPVFSAIVAAFGSPLAAPSANRFGRISPTSAHHVREELDGRIPLIVDAGATTHGVESTIVAVRNGGIDLLRYGPITVEQLREFGPLRIASARDQPEAPGQLRSHYAPRTRLTLVDQLSAFEHVGDKRVGALSWRGTDARGFAEVRTLSARGDLAEAAANLFRCLRELDAAGLDAIIAEEVPEVGLGAAIMDRLRRAAA